MISEHELQQFDLLTEIHRLRDRSAQESWPGLLERTYEAAMCMEMGLRRLAFERQSLFPIECKGTTISEHRIDLIVENTVVVELKRVDRRTGTAGRGAKIPIGSSLRSLSLCGYVRVRLP